MTLHRVALFLAVALCAHSTVAAPTLTVSELGPTPAGDRLWIAQITPDAVGSMAVELAFDFENTDLLSVDVLSAKWPADNPGHNPFTGTETDGLYIDFAKDRVFGAFGSTILSPPNPVDLFLFETSGLGVATVYWGTAASGISTKGNIIANAQGTFRYTGSLTVVPEPATLALVAMSFGGLALVMRRRNG